MPAADSGRRSLKTRGSADVSRSAKTHTLHAAADSTRTARPNRTKLSYGHMRATLSSIGVIAATARTRPHAEWCQPFGGFERFLRSPISQRRLHLFSPNQSDTSRTHGRFPAHYPAPRSSNRATGNSKVQYVAFSGNNQD